MFYPPSLLDLNNTPKPAPFYDAPIARRPALRSLAARVARGAWSRRPPETSPEPSPRVVVLGLRDRCGDRV